MAYFTDFIAKQEAVETTKPTLSSVNPSIAGGAEIWEPLDSYDPGPTHTGNGQNPNPVPEGTSTATPIANAQEPTHTGGSQLDGKNPADTSGLGYGGADVTPIDPIVNSSQWGEGDSAAKGGQPLLQEGRPMRQLFQA